MSDQQPAKEVTPQEKETATNETAAKETETALKETAAKETETTPKTEESKKEVSAGTETEGVQEEEDVEAEVTTGNWNLPQVHLEEVEAKTGEEDEEEVWKHRSKLYRWQNEWKERGLGEGRLLKDKEGKVRFVMRQEKTGKVVANHYVIAEDNRCKLTTNVGSDKIWVWTVLDSAEEPTVEQFALRFGTAEAAEDFKKAFEKAAADNALLLEKDQF